MENWRYRLMISGNQWQKTLEKIVLIVLVVLQRSVVSECDLSMTVCCLFWICFVIFDAHVITSLTPYCDSVRDRLPKITSIGHLTTLDALNCCWAEHHALFPLQIRFPCPNLLSPNLSILNRNLDIANCADKSHHRQHKNKKLIEHKNELNLKWRIRLLGSIKDW